MIKNFYTKVSVKAGVIWLHLRNFYKLAKMQNHAMYRIEEFDLNKKLLTIQCRGTNAFIKTSFDAAIEDTSIVDGLPATQACWLGYQYGKHFTRKQHSSAESKFFLRANPNYRFKMTGFLPQSAELIYVDIEKKQIHKKAITQVTQDESILYLMHPSQACYIGMLIAREVERHGAEILIGKLTPPALYIVK